MKRQFLGTVDGVDYYEPFVMLGSFNAASMQVCHALSNLYLAIADSGGPEWWTRSWRRKAHEVWPWRD